MLFAPTLEEHLAIMKTLFTEDDVILDIGCTYDSIGHAKIDEDTDLSQISFSSFNTLLFQESIGYLTFNEILSYISLTSAKKIVIKDFVLTEPPPDPSPFNYDFTVFQFQILPLLLSLGYKAGLSSFLPNRTRWKKILEENCEPYIEYPGIKNVIGVFVK